MMYNHQLARGVVQQEEMMTAVFPGQHMAQAPSPAPPPPSETRQQCWECLRRRWVCDASRPVCNKCRAAGIVCPGYNDQKPLTWLAPGRVTSRTRRKQPQNQAKRAKPSASGNGVSNKTINKKAATPSPKISNRSVRGSISEASASDSLKTEYEKQPPPKPSPTISNLTGPTTYAAAKQATSAPRPEQPSSELVEAIQYYNSQIFPYLASNQLAPNAFVFPFTNPDGLSTSLRHALISMALTHRLHRMPRNESPVQASTAAVDPASSPRDSIASTNSSSPAPSAARGSVASVSSNRSSVTSASSHRGSVVGAGIRDTLTALGNGGNGFGESDAVGPGALTTADMWRRLHHHMGLAIRALNEELSTDKNRRSDATIINLLVFLTGELRQAVSPHWRPHLNGLMNLISCRGGLGRLIDSAAQLRTSLLSFTIVSVIGNTASPSSEQTPATAHLNMIDLIAELYSIGIFPSLPCPVPLFLDIIHINYLRFQLSTDSNAFLDDSIQAFAALVFSRIDGFSPEAWLQGTGEGAFWKEWLLIARIFQSAVALYALWTLPWVDSLLSLQSTNSATPTERFNYNLQVMKSVHRARLFSLLESALTSPVVRRGMVWPLVVAGVEAAMGSEEEREFVEQHLFELSQSMGTAHPIVAKNALQKFWASGLTSWDACFHQSYTILA